MTSRPVHQRGLRTVRARICAAAVMSVGAALVVAGVVLVGLVRRSLEQPMRGEARATPMRKRPIVARRVLESWRMRTVTVSSAFVVSFCWKVRARNGVPVSP